MSPPPSHEVVKTNGNGNDMTSAIAVYCGASFGKDIAYEKGAASVGKALARSNRQLIYGGGFSGLMGATAKAALANGGKIIGITPYAMVNFAGGEGSKCTGSECNGSDSLKSRSELLNEEAYSNSNQIENIYVQSMHERKVEMAKRACGFIGLPGGFGTFEEVVEVTTWTQIGIHNKPIVLLNILSFYNPLRLLIKTSIEAGFIGEEYEDIVVFVDGPENRAEHEEFDWGGAALRALDRWTEVLDKWEREGGQAVGESDFLGTRTLPPPCWRAHNPLKMTILAIINQSACKNDTVSSDIPFNVIPLMLLKAEADHGDHDIDAAQPESCSTPGTRLAPEAVPKTDRTAEIPLCSRASDTFQSRL
ncbi:hypothetical protein D9758_001549 [Tetrapyrgos nigripes]|uniref:Cytokinin riboside 5'-monophosphate phosphoribohydrolase n=1 Tax=Tetrapyrgos nigripes TaxID=182062 RepID=A0A8H5GXR2_9AGAR|nr:hypothetical protein D9758_001549 [Tetrapyrgos nigripes]